MITRDDLLKEISLKELTQLTDLNAKGDIDEEVLADAIADAEAFIGSFIEIPPTPTPLLREIAVRLTLDYLRRRNRLGDDASHDAVRKEAERLLLKMAAKKIPAAPQDGAPRPAGFSFRHRRKKLDTEGYL